MKLNSLSDLLTEQLKDLYSAESQLTKALLCLLVNLKGIHYAHAHHSSSP